MTTTTALQNPAYPVYRSRGCGFDVVPLRLSTPAFPRPAIPSIESDSTTALGAFAATQKNMAYSAWAGGESAASVPAPAPTSSADRHKKSQSRQLLSCTKCRERKVKCDRTKPCSACCARGHPKGCDFVVVDGNDYGPIVQSYEIRKLRQENQRLKERLQAARLPHSGDEDEDDVLSDRKDERQPSRAVTARQRRFKTGDRVDNLYFGTPGLANIVSEFANLQVGDHSLTHTMPKARDMYGADESTDRSYPFPVVARFSTIPTLLQLLPGRGELFAYLELFQRRAQSCSFPHTPDEVTRKEVERFLADAEHNAEMLPDMLALIFATLATGLQMGQHDRNGGRWVEGAVEAARTDSDAYIGASMQALRIASFMNRPTLLGIQTLVMMGPYLTNSGRFLDAWTLFGTTIRLAHSIGLHRNPKFLDPVPPLRECTTRQTLWWWMLHMDQQYSVTLGRPLGISGYGDCPPPEPLTTNPTELRLGKFIDYFTILARQILGSDGLMNVAKIDELTDKLIGTWDTMPAALQFNESWLQETTVLPEWPLEVMSATLFTKVQSFLILLNRQRVERTQHAATRDTSPTISMAPPSRTLSMTVQQPSPNQPDLFHHPAAVRGRDLVVNSSIHILHTFVFFHHRRPAVLLCWTLCQQAFNACMIIILDSWETNCNNNDWIVHQVYTVFHELERKGVHKLAEMAVKRISDGIARLGNRHYDQTKALGPYASSGRGSTATQHSYPHQPHGYKPPLHPLDTALTDWTGDTVMGNTGMFLLEETGPHASTTSQQPFQPLTWNNAGSHPHPSTAHPSAHASPTPADPHIPSPLVPLSDVDAVPFPAMSPPFTSAALPATAWPVTDSPFAVDLQPRTSAAAHTQHPQHPPPHHLSRNPPPQHHQQLYPQPPPRRPSIRHQGHHHPPPHAAVPTAAAFTPINASGFPAPDGGGAGTSSAHSSSTGAVPAHVPPMPQPPLLPGGKGGGGRGRSGSGSGGGSESGRGRGHGQKVERAGKSAQRRRK